VSIAGRRIEGGMLYVGNGLGSIADSHVAEPSLVNPALRVAVRPAPPANRIGYWPSYSRLEPEGRTTYLDWLATGRRDPAYDIGYVFLFFYGLERRLLHEAQSVHETERKALLNELRWLLSVYGDSGGSFRSYADGLFEAEAIRCSALGLADLEPPATPPSGGYPLQLKYGLARLVAAGSPIPWEWALSWFLCCPETSLRTAGTRCHSEFRALFAWRYVAQYGTGMRLEPNKTRLKLSYRPASASFGGEVTLTGESLPDVTALRTPLQRLQALAEECLADLDAYSRYLGRHESSRGSPAATALLPRELVAAHRGDETMALRDYLSAALGQRESAVVPTDDLILRFNGEPAEKLAKKEAVSLVQLLDKCGYGLEPDVRFGGPALKGGGEAVLFALEEGAPAGPSAAYAVATLVCHLFSLVAGADGVVSSSEIRTLMSYLEAFLELSEPEQARLRAHLRWLQSARPSMRGLHAQLSSLKRSEKEALGTLMVQVAWAEQGVAPEEVAALERVFGLLGLDPEDVHRRLHSLGTMSLSPTEPVLVIEAEPGAPGVAIPPPDDAASGPAGPVGLDMELIRRKLMETAHVSRLLGDIFEEDEAPEATADKAPAAEVVCTCGLDAAHSALLLDLSRHGELSRSAMAELAEKHGLLPDGALDTINDAALELCDEMLCEGDQVLTLNQEVLKVMLP
jgi:uncharacterized tellurite resistance protein B-like protein